MGQRSVTLYISVCITVDKKERKMSGRRKKMQTKYQTKQKNTNHREQRKEERNIQCKHLLLKKHNLCVENTKLLDCYLP